MFKIIEAKDEDLIKEIYRFRADITCNELGSVKREECIDGMEIDEYDKYSHQFAILDEVNDIVACVRLVNNSKVGYPTPNALKMDMDYYNKLSKMDYKEIGELSRIFISKKYRGMKTTKQIINLLKYKTCMKMTELGIICSYGSLEENFLRLLNIFKMPYRKIGPYQFYGNRMRAPCIMYTDELIELNKELFFETVH